MATRGHIMHFCAGHSLSSPGPLAALAFSPNCARDLCHPIVRYYRVQCRGKPAFRLLTILPLLKWLLRTIPDAFRGKVFVARISYSSGKHTRDNSQYREASQFLRNFL